jgi:hypothetical protein
MRFRDTAGPDSERAVVRYDLVRMTDVPDEITGQVMGELQSGDEVEIVERRGVWVYVRTPYGGEGWVHRTTLGSPPPTQTAPVRETAGPTEPGQVPQEEATAPTLETMLENIAAQRRPDRSPTQEQRPSTSPS